MLKSFYLPVFYTAAGGDPVAGKPAAGHKISPRDLISRPSMPRLEMFLLQFSQDHEVTPDEVELIATAYKGLEPILARALRSRAQVIIERFGTEEAKHLARESGLLDK